MDPNKLPGNPQTPPPVDYNAATQQAGVPGRQPIRPVVQATVIPNAKKSFGQKFKEAFAPAPGQGDIGEGILKNVIAPMIKGTIFAGITGALGALLYGATGGFRPPYAGYGYGTYNPYAWGAPRYGMPAGAVDYSAMARPQAPTAAQLPPANKGPGSVQDVIFKTRAEAELVKDNLAEILTTFHQVSLLDFYETCGVQGNGYTDAYIGWNDLSRLHVRECYGGWIIDLPRPQMLGRA